MSPSSASPPAASRSSSSDEPAGARPVRKGNHRVRRRARQHLSLRPLPAQLIPRRRWASAGLDPRHRGRGAARALAALRALPAARLVGGLDLAYRVERPNVRAVPSSRQALSRCPDGSICGRRRCARAGHDRHQHGRAGPASRASRPRLADQRMAEPARAIARILSARGQRVYEYRFGYVATARRKTLSGAPHASEIPYVFDTVCARYGKETSRADEAMARVVHAYWIAFARSGRPVPPDSRRGRSIITAAMSS